MTPSNEMIQGSWKQDFPKEPAFEPPPEWEKIEFRNDSFFMRIRSSTDMITAKNCYQGTWFTYTKGVYNIDSMKIHFDGIITDSSYSTKVDTCHGIGKYQPEFGITLCGDLLTLKVILKSDTIPEERLKAFPEEKLKVKMYRY